MPRRDEAAMLYSALRRGGAAVPRRGEAAMLYSALRCRGAAINHSSIAEENKKLCVSAS